MNQKSKPTKSLSLDFQSQMRLDSYQKLKNQKVKNELSNTLSLIQIWCDYFNFKKDYFRVSFDLILKLKTISFFITFLMCNKVS